MDLIYIDDVSYNLIKIITKGLARLINKLMDRVLLFTAAEVKTYICSRVVSSAISIFGP